jgi:hypothetical protein
MPQNKSVAHNTSFAMTADAIFHPNSVKLKQRDIADQLITK